MFAAVVCVGLWVGFHEPRLAELVPIGVGVTAYGIAYAVVHDVYIHRRLRWFGDHRVPLLDRLADAHALHHRYGGRAVRHARAGGARSGARRGEHSGAQRVASVPRSRAGVGLEAGEQLLAVPTVGPCAPDDIGMARGSGERTHRRHVRPQAERAEPADGELTDAGRGEQPWGLVQLAD